MSFKTRWWRTEFKTGIYTTEHLKINARKKSGALTMQVSNFKWVVYGLNSLLSNNKQKLAGRASLCLKLSCACILIQGVFLWKIISAALLIVPVQLRLSICLPAPCWGLLHTNICFIIRLNNVFVFFWHCEIYSPNHGWWSKLQEHFSNSC